MRNLDLKTFEKCDHNMVLATGVVTEPSLHIDPIRWVAVKGWGEDWAIYYHFEVSSLGLVREQGDKITSANLIQNLVPCTQEVLDKYRL